MMIQRSIIILITLVFATGCMITDNIKEAFLFESSDISLIWKGEVQVRYTPKDYQMAYNSDRNEYRVYNDRLADWFIVSCSEKPAAVGQRLIADVLWTGKNENKVFTDIELTVEKADDTGMIWLWSSSKKIGIIIKTQ